MATAQLRKKDVWFSWFCLNFFFFDSCEFDMYISMDVDEREDDCE